jgi:hypothetical protein
MKGASVNCRHQTNARNKKKDDSPNCLMLGRRACHVALTPRARGRAGAGVCGWASASSRRHAAWAWAGARGRRACMPPNPAACPDTTMLQGHGRGLSAGRLEKKKINTKEKKQKRLTVAPDAGMLWAHGGGRGAWAGAGVGERVVWGRGCPSIESPAAAQWGVSSI